MNAGWTLLPADHALTRTHAARDLPPPGLMLPLELVYPAGRAHGPAVSAFVRLARMGPTRLVGGQAQG